MFVRCRNAGAGWESKRTRKGVWKGEPAYRELNGISESPVEFLCDRQRGDAKPDFEWLTGLTSQA
jgi:hypothetical protein